MKTLILSDTGHSGSSLEIIADNLENYLSEQGDSVTRIHLGDKTIGCCTGCFGCWLKTPGECVLTDDGRRIAKQLIESHRVIIVTPIRFGSVSALMKRAIERQIPNISPLFQKWRGEWHHRKRYPGFPDFAVIGWIPSPDSDTEQVFRNLFQRNQVNFRSSHPMIRIVHSDEPLDCSEFVDTWMRNNPETGSPAFPGPVSDAFLSEPESEHGETGRLLCVIGSPAGERSSSARLAETVAQSFPDSDWNIQYRYIYRTPGTPETPDMLIDDMIRAHRMVWAFPLYVDGVPSGMLEAMEHCMDRVQSMGETHPSVPVLGICNCGFPESHQCDTALDIFALFVREAGMRWIGGLSIGEGGMIHGNPLNGDRGPTRRLYHACRRAGDDLRNAVNLSPEARRDARRPMVPYWLYAFIGGIGMRRSFKPAVPGLKLEHRPHVYPEKDD